jgi:hypothetical protein
MRRFLLMLMAMAKVMALAMAPVFAASMATACAKVVVVPIDGNKQPAAGVFYALPRTVIRVNVKVERKEPKGKDVPFMAYADIFAPGMDTACSDRDCADDGVTYSLKDGATLSTYGEPDARHVYMVKFANGGTVDQTLNLAWSETGLVSTLSASVTNRGTDVATSAVKAIAGIGVRAAFGGAGVEEPTPACPIKSANDDWVIPVLRPGQLVTEASRTLVANYCALTKARRDELTKAKHRVPLTAARDAYGVRIEPLLGALGKQLAGTSYAANPVEMVERLEGLIADQLNALYLGTVDTKTWDGALDVRTYPADQEAPLLVVDKTAGVCVKAELAPHVKPLPAAFKQIDEKTCAATAANVNLTVAFHPKKEDQLFHKVETATTKPAGDLSFRYRIPAQVRAIVTLKQQAATAIYGAGVFSVAQEDWGYVAALPATRHSKTLSYDLGFIEATGGLKSFKLGATGGVDAATIDAAGGVANSVLDARSAHRDK